MTTGGRERERERERNWSFHFAQHNLKLFLTTCENLFGIDLRPIANRQRQQPCILVSFFE